MKEKLKVEYTLTVYLEHNGELIDPTDAIEVVVRSTDGAIKLNWDMEKVEEEILQ